jgi:sulfonate transport system substrate-binding protein
MTIVVGAHPQNPSLSILARRADLVADLRAEGLSFFVYGAGAATIPLFQLGVIQLGGTGATPLIFAKAQGLAVAAFGMSEPRHERGGVVVARDSSIHTLEDLCGRNIALMPISWHTQFLAAELAAAGLKWADVNAVELTPATAKDALVAGRLDAIVATDPLLEQIEQALPVRVVAKPGATFSNRSVFWGRHDVLANAPRAVQALSDALAESDRLTQADPQAAAALLDGVNGSSAAQWLPALIARPWGVQTPDDAFLEEQQRHADVFARFGLIDRSVDMTDTVSRDYTAASAATL